MNEIKPDKQINEELLVIEGVYCCICKKEISLEEHEENHYTAFVDGINKGCCKECFALAKLMGSRCSHNGRYYN